MSWFYSGFGVQIPSQLHAGLVHDEWLEYLQFSTVGDHHWLQWAIFLICWSV